VATAAAITVITKQFVKEVGGGGGSINNAQFVNLMVRSLSAVNVQSLGTAAFDTSLHNGTAAASDNSSSTPQAQPTSTFRAIVQSASKLALVKLGLAKEGEEQQERAATTAASSIVSSSSKHGTSLSGSNSQAALDAEQLRLAEEAERSTRQHGHVYSSSGNIEIDGIVYDGIEF
jgi:hypothetical protein